jgi:hypothetical protein
MKKIFIIITILFQLTIVFGQKSEWGSWSTNPCYKGISFRVRKTGYNESAKQTTYDIEIQNSYTQKVTLNFDIRNTSLDGRVSINEKSNYSTWFMNNDKEIWVDIDRVCFDINDYCSINSNGKQNKGYKCYAECDNGIPKVPTLCGNVSEENNNSSQNSISTQKDDTQKQQQDDSQKQEQERQQKETDRVVQKTSNFTDLINDGDAKFNEGKYNDAISKYTQAKNLYTGNILPQEEAYAKDAIPLANARIAQAEKALKDAARKERVDKAYEADKKEDIAFASAAAGAIGIMAFLKDQFSYRQTFLKLQVGLGMEGLPLITNTAILGKSQTDLSIHPDFFFGFKLGLMNKLPVNIHITPYFQYGFNALKKGVKGGHINTGVTGTLFASWKNTGIFKLFFESSFYYRVGSYTYDVDAVNGGSSATDEVRTGDYSYSAYNFGGGFMIDIIKEKSKGNMQTYIKPGVYFEKALFYPKGIPYTLVAKLEVNIVSQIVLQVDYCHYYHIGGTVNYRNDFESKNRPYFGVRIIRNGNLIPLVPKKYRHKK